MLLLVSKDSLNGINNIACVDSHMEEVEADRFNPIEEEFDEEAQDQYVRKCVPIEKDLGTKGVLVSTFFIERAQ